MDTKISLEEAKELQIESLIALDNICKENDLQMWLYGGTLLGAVREGGRIEWDDDIDVIMSFSDLIRLQEADLGDFELSTPEMNFAIDSTVKFGKKGYYTFDCKQDQENGHRILAGLDVFAFIEVDKDTFHFIDEYKRFIRKFRLEGMKREGKYEQARLAYLSYFETLRKIDGTIDSGIVYDCLANRYRNVEYLYKKSWFNDNEVEYEGRKYLGGKTKGLLKVQYGDDYMTPKKTHTHYFAKNVFKEDE